MGRKRIGALLVFFVTAGGFLGCSQDGDLIVKNDCKTEFEGYIDNEFVEVAPGDEVSKNIYIGKRFIVGPEDVDVEILGSARTKRYFATTITVSSGEKTIYEITDDVGALVFRNAYSLQINGISSKLCDSLEFGANFLPKNQPLSPGTAKIIQLEEGCWDILVNYGREQHLDTVTAVPVAIGQVITISWIPGYVYNPPAYNRSPH